jgi:hypothetical protein
VSVWADGFPGCRPPVCSGLCGTHWKAYTSIAVKDLTRVGRESSGTRWQFPPQVSGRPGRHRAQSRGTADGRGCRRGGREFRLRAAIGAHGAYKVSDISEASRSVGPKGPAGGDGFVGCAGSEIPGTWWCRTEVEAGAAATRTDPPPRIVWDNRTFGLRRIVSPAGTRRIPPGTRARRLERNPPAPKHSPPARPGSFSNQCGQPTRRQESRWQKN